MLSFISKLYLTGVSWIAPVFVQFLVSLLVVQCMPIDCDKVSCKLLIISFDGFRWDYINKSANIPNFKRMMDNGAWVNNGLKNAFLTKTFPNHYTLVTGLYEESHGIVGNKMYDPVLDETFLPDIASEQSDPRWFDNGGEPIWVTNQRQCTQHRSGVLYWPGNEAPIKGILPYKHLPYDYTKPLNERIDIIISWFIDDYPINLGLLYYPEPDATGHKNGPDSPEIIAMIEELDRGMGYLFEQLEKHGLLSSMNIIVTSDHGMTSTPADKVINLDDYIDNNSYMITSSNPIAAIRPNTAELGEEIIKNLSKINHLHVYRKEDIPDEFHYKHNRRIQPILVVTDEHYSLSHNASKEVPAGNHGYNNSLQSMHPIFLGLGPSFKPKSQVEALNNVDVYPLSCKLLNLKPAPNNGSLDIAESLLVDGDTNSKEGDSTFAVYMVLVLFVCLISGLFGIAACAVHRQTRRRQLFLRTLPGQTVFDINQYRDRAGDRKSVV